MVVAAHGPLGQNVSTRILSTLAERDTFVHLTEYAYLPEISRPAPAASVGSQSVTCISPSYSEPHRASGMWLVEYTNAGT